MFWRHGTNATNRAVAPVGATATPLSRVWYVCIPGVTCIVVETQTVLVRVIVYVVLAVGKT